MSAHLKALEERVTTAKQKMRSISDEIDAMATKEAEGTAPTGNGKREAMNRLQSGYNKAEREYMDARSEWEKALFDSRTGGEITTIRGDNPRSSDELDADPFSEPRSIRSDRSGIWSELGPQASPGEYRSRALSAVERMSGASDSVREAATKIIEEFDDNGSISRLALVASDPDYLRAFTRMAMNPQHPMLSEREVSAVRRVQREARAMSLTDTSGGYMVPFQLDPTVIITSDGSTNPIRQLARKVVATGDVWNGVSSTAVTWSWDTEGTQVDDNATTYAQPSIPVHKAAGFVPISLEALQDAANVAQEVGRQLAFGKDVLESAALTVGSGSDEPTGIVTALSGGSSVVSATTDGTFGAVDIYRLDEALPARHRGRASWLMSRSIMNDIAQFETSNGSLKFPTIQNVPPTLLNRPAYEASDMDSTLSTGTVDHILVIGDFSNFVVADRVGTVVEFIPHLFGANQRPTGQRGWYAHVRLGSDSVNDGAFRVLNN